MDNANVYAGVLSAAPAPQGRFHVNPLQLKAAIQLARKHLHLREQLSDVDEQLAIGMQSIQEQHSTLARHKAFCIALRSNPGMKIPESEQALLNLLSSSYRRSVEKVEALRDTHLQLYKELKSTGKEYRMTLRDINACYYPSAMADVSDSENDEPLPLHLKKGKRGRPRKKKPTEDESGSPDGDGQIPPMVNGTVNNGALANFAHVPLEATFSNGTQQIVASTLPAPATHGEGFDPPGNCVPFQRSDDTEHFHEEEEQGDIDNQNTEPMKHESQSPEQNTIQDESALAGSRNLLLNDSALKAVVTNNDADHVMDGYNEDCQTSKDTHKKGPFGNLPSPDSPEPDPFANWDEILEEMENAGQIHSAGSVLNTPPGSKLDVEHMRGLGSPFQSSRRESEESERKTKLRRGRGVTKSAEISNSKKASVPLPEVGRRKEGKYRVPKTVQETPDPPYAEKIDGSGSRVKGRRKKKLEESKDNEKTSETEAKKKTRSKNKAKALKKDEKSCKGLAEELREIREKEAKEKAEAEAEKGQSKWHNRLRRKRL